MDDEAILRKAITKAIENGWKKPDDELASVVFGYGDWGEFERLGQNYEQWGGFMEARGLKDILFNHDFAKALWGEEPHEFPIEGTQYAYVNSIVNWQYHLQQMVLADDPIKYLSENI